VLSNVKGIMRKVSKGYVAGQIEAASTYSPKQLVITTLFFLAILAGGVLMFVSFWNMEERILSSYIMMGLATIVAAIGGVFLSYCLGGFWLKLQSVKKLPSAPKAEPAS